MSTQWLSICNDFVKISARALMSTRPWCFLKIGVRYSPMGELLMASQLLCYQRFVLTALVIRVMLWTRGFMVTLVHSTLNHPDWGVPNEDSDLLPSYGSLWWLMSRQGTTACHNRGQLVVPTAPRISDPRPCQRSHVTKRLPQVLDTTSV